MNETRTFIKKNLSAEDLAWSSTPIIKGVSCWYVIHSDTGGYTEDVRNFYIFEDGTVMIDSDHERYSISLRTEQVNLLRDFLTGDSNG